MHYDRNWVLAAYRAEHQNRRNPSAQILEEYDQTLFDRYEDQIQKQAEATIPLNLFNRSVLMYFASRADVVAAATQVRHAYEFFRNTQPTP